MEQSALYGYQDTLVQLNRNIPLSEKLGYLHEVILGRYEFIDRIAVALYDDKTDLLKSFLHSSAGQRPLAHYQARLEETPSLKEILVKGRPRLVNDLGIFRGSDKAHARKIRQQGYASSYTMPMYLNGEFFGFLFFNADRADVFDNEVLHYLDLFGHLLSLTVINELSNLRTLLAAIKTACDITHHRDNETGSHLDRMSRYARLIALEIADQYRLDDQFIEQLYMFSPLHDIGKIGIPDSILLKPGALTDAEYEVMKSHVHKGREIIDTMLSNFDLDGVHRIDMLRNIAEYHHEAIDGSGYPAGLTGDAIPIESKIIAVADVFDALTSQRPYKEAWDNDEAFSLLERLAGSQLDADCVAALARRRDEVERIQARFAEDPFG